MSIDDVGSRTERASSGLRPAEGCIACGHFVTVRTALDLLYEIGALQRVVVGESWRPLATNYAGHHAVAHRGSSR